MRRFFVIVPSGVEVDPSGDRDIAKVTATIIRRTVTVITQECVGEGVIIAGKIITSLFLVRDHMMVQIRASRRRPVQAIVYRRDERNRLAELKLAEIAPDPERFPIPSGEARVNTGPIGAIGSPVLTTRANCRSSAVMVAGTSYGIRYCDRREDEVFKEVHDQLPDGEVGSGVWNLDGEFLGLSLGRKVRYFHREFDTHDMHLALPASAVLDFAESS